MNRDSVIKKFVEKAGPLKPFPQYHFVTGENKQNMGLTTELSEFFKAIKLSDIIICSFQDRLKNGFSHHFNHPLVNYSVDFPITDVETCMRLLQNSPFSKILMIFGKGQGLPIAFSRSDCNIAILLAPIMLEIVELTENEKNKKFRQYKSSLRWVSSLPDTTFWICEVPSGDSTIFITKCKVCGEEKEVGEWTKLRDAFHPQCYCQCDTYGDECGCRAKRLGQRYDRFKGNYTVDEPFHQYVENTWKPTVQANPHEYLYWHEREITYKGFPYWLRQ